jgi:hypothetical protein
MASNAATFRVAVTGRLLVGSVGHGTARVTAQKLMTLMSIVGTVRGV